MLSSGTTALPKISLYSSNNFHALANQTLDALRCQRDDIAAGLASCGTGAVGYIFPVMSPLLHGASSVLLEHWDPAAGVDMLLKHRCTYAVAVPAQMTQMLPLLKTHSPLDFANFRAFFNGGAPLPHEVARQVEELMDCRVLCNYGSTDGGVCVTITWDDSREKRLSTVGRPGVEREVKLVDSNGNTVASGEQGEIYWRSPEKSYGYMNDEAATQVAFTEDRFYRSGDLGRLDEDGYLMVVGRVKDMILRGGRNMSPRIIEDTMIKHPAVLEVAVAAMPDPILGERACAFAVLKNGSKLEFDELIAFLKREKLSVWMLPERLEIMEDLPRSAGGKIAKNKLTAFISARLQEEAGQRGS
jgi:acyl-CoA synthetase (AMP-forming)/AMP-acid ligase II